MKSLPVQSQSTPVEAAQAETAQPSEPEASPTPSTPPRPELAPDVADILRSEAERETALRKQVRVAPPKASGTPAEAEDADTTAKGSAPQTPQRVRVSRRDMPRRGADRMSRPAPEDVASAPSSMDQRKDLLPNIDDVTRKLGKQGDPELQKPAEDSSEKAVVEQPDTRSGGAFTRGFAFALLIAVVAWLVYSESDEIAGQFPQAEPYLQGYVDGINDARVWIDAQVGAVVPR